MESRGGGKDWNETKRTNDIYLLVSTIFMRSRSLLTPGDLVISDEK